MDDDMTNLSKPRPTGWNESLLGPHFEHMWSNSLATFANVGNARRAKDIDALMYHFGTNMEKVKGKAALDTGLPLLLFLRAHAAFRSGLALGFSGACVETMPVLRLCLETAGYARLMKGNNRLALIWGNRSQSDETKKAARNAFKASDVTACLKSHDGKLASTYQKLYETTIEAGAHQNEFGFMTNLTVTRLDDGGAMFTQVYLQDDPKRVDFVLRTAGRVGVCVLKIFEQMHPELFKELGISERMPHVAAGL
jgi:hypothetical protein